jgi:hypothetical protein
VIVTVYIDESGTHGSPVTILGGWVGSLGQWAGFDPKWAKLLKRNRLTHFHSKKFKHTQEEFKGWPIIRKQVFLDTASSLAVQNLAFGFTIALPEQVYRDHYVANHRPKEIPLDSRYGLCFRYCLSLIPGLAQDRFVGRKLDINFVLEEGHKNAGDALRVFNLVKQTRVDDPAEIAIMKMLGTIAFDEKKKYPGLQIADVNAYSAFQHETGTRELEVVTLPNEGTMKAARKIQRLPIFRLEIRDTEAKMFKKFILNEIEEKKARRKTNIISSSGRPS